MIFSRGFFKISLVICASSLLASAGCTQHPIDTGEPDSPKLPGQVTAPEMAKRLGLRMTSSSTTMTVLQNPANSVILYSDPDGRAYVNGSTVGRPGGFKMVNGVLHMPDSIEPAIRTRLKTQAETVVVISDPPIAPPVLPGTKLGKIVLDPGHGGKDPGNVAAGASNPEKDFNLAIALAVEKCLKEQRVDVIMTRRTDRFPELDDRVDVANGSGAAAFVSIHANANDRRDLSGHEIISPARGCAKSDALAASISSQMLRSGSTLNRNYHDERGLRVMVKTKIPAVIVEVGYMSNAAERARLLSRDYQQRMAKAIADGIVAYLRK